MADKTSTSAMDVAKAGWGAFSAVKDVATAVTSPVRFVKDKLLELVVSALLATLKATVGPKLAQLALDRMNVVGKTLPFSVPITLPATVAGRLDAEVLMLAQNAANEALAGPLELLGYRLGQVKVSFDAESRVLTVDFEAGIMVVASSAEAARLGQPEEPPVEAATKAA